MDIFFSIIIPTYNRADFIAKTVQSVLSQTYSHYELIIVDDGSTDGTEEVIQQFADARVHYFKKENAERGAARNFGARLAKGNYVTFFDSDDLLLPHHLQTACDTIALHHNPRMFHLNYQIYDRDGKHLGNGPIYSHPILNKLSLVKGNPLSCNGVFIERELLLQNLFHEDRQLSASEDYELWVRLASRVDVIMNNEITSTIIIHHARSVLTSNETKLLLRKNLFMQYAFADTAVQQVFGPYRAKFAANFDTYIALHLALDGKIIPALRYFFSALKTLPTLLFERRSLAIIKHCLFSLIKKSST